MEDRHKTKHRGPPMILTICNSTRDTPLIFKVTFKIHVKSPLAINYLI